MKAIPDNVPKRQGFKKSLQREINSKQEHQLLKIPIRPTTTAKLVKMNSSNFRSKTSKTETELKNVASKQSPASDQQINKRKFDVILHDTGGLGKKREAVPVVETAKYNYDNPTKQIPKLRGSIDGFYVGRNTIRNEEDQPRTLVKQRIPLSYDLATPSGHIIDSTQPLLQISNDDSKRNFLYAETAQPNTYYNAKNAGRLTSLAQEFSRPHKSQPTIPTTPSHLPPATESRSLTSRIQNLKNSLQPNELSKSKNSLTKRNMSPLSGIYFKTIPGTKYYDRKPSISRPAYAREQLFRENYERASKIRSEKQRLKSERMHLESILEREQLGWIRISHPSVKMNILKSS